MNTEKLKNPFLTKLLTYALFKFSELLILNLILRVRKYARLTECKDKMKTETRPSKEGLVWCRGEDLNLHSFWELAPKASVSAIPPPRLKARAL